MSNKDEDVTSGCNVFLVWKNILVFRLDKFQHFFNF
jgi:hypothetical protein